MSMTLYPDLPERPIIITDPSHHTMGQSLRRYVCSRVHEMVDNSSYSRIIVRGSYDRSRIVSVKEKRGKLENWQRPTAELRDGELIIHCFPGRWYVLHYGSLIATHLALTGRNPKVVDIQPPGSKQCWQQLEKSGYYALQPTSAVVVASGNLSLAPPGAVWNEHATYQVREEQTGHNRISWLAVKHSFWGDIAYHLGALLADIGFPTVIFVGKLGSFRPGHIPNETIATGSDSSLYDETINWANLFSAGGPFSIRAGRHVTLPSVLQETIAWRDSLSEDFDFVDPEIGNFAAGVIAGGGQFSYLHIVSDNLARTFHEDLSNEREGAVPMKRTALYENIGDIVRGALAKL